MATLNLYYTAQGTTNWELNPANLFIVEDIETYLASKTSRTISNFQYQKHALELSFVLDLSQEYAQPKGIQFRYVAIQNSADEPIYYYFVKNVIWRSKSSVRFELIMDVLNTFKENTAYKFKESTKISREHKDRYSIVQSGRLLHIPVTDFNEEHDVPPEGTQVWFAVDEGDIESSFFTGYLHKVIYEDDVVKEIQILIDPDDHRTDNVILGVWRGYWSEDDAYDMIHTEDENEIISLWFTYDFDTPYITGLQEIFRNIDYVQENINPILQCGSASGVKIQNNKNPLKQNWYLLYRNQNDPSPDDLTTPVECYLIPENASAIYGSALVSGKLYPSALENNKYYYINMLDSAVTLSNGVTLGRYLYYMDFLIVKKQSNGLFSVTYCEGGVGGTDDLENVETYTNIEYINLHDLPQKYSETATPYDIETYITTILGNETDSWSSSDVEKSVDGINLLDKADPKNIKLIKMPYCPYNFTITSNKINLTDSVWNYETITQDNGDMNVLRLSDLNHKLHSDIKTDSQPLTNLYVGNSEDIDPRLTDTRYPLATLPDSKLFHSEFYKPTYVYDSFTYAVQLEKIDTSEYADESDVTSFYIRFDMTSTINSKFMFTFYSFSMKNAESNFAQVMPISRNNEEVLYNVAYISYIKTGYNYDLKNKQISNASNYIGLGLSAIATGASLFAPTIPLKVAGVLGGLVSLAMSLKSTITTTIQNENSIRQKLDQTANQTASVQGSDDVDLMSVYAENRLKYYVYEPNAVMKSLLNDLFFYAGYKSDRMGLPNHNTRVNFDYLECDPVFENLGSIPNDCLQELINAFKTGVTYLHKTSRASNKWDFKQEYENWENSLLGE